MGLVITFKIAGDGQNITVTISPPWNLPGRNLFFLLYTFIHFQTHLPPVSRFDIFIIKRKVDKTTLIQNIATDFMRTELEIIYMWYSLSIEACI